MTDPEPRSRDSAITRRAAVGAMGALACGAMLQACRTEIPLLPYRGARLLNRPRIPTEPGVSGRTDIEIAGSHASVYVPSSVERARPAALLLFLHGALRNVDVFLEGHRAGAEDYGVIVVAPYASLGTWDAVRATFDIDVDVLDAVLAWTFARWTIDPGRIAISGFSDGATYSLGMGRSNGDLFTRVIAYSPGFLIDVTPVGRPPVLISHGTEDTVLPVQNTNRFIVPWLRQEGYPVDYREFAGPHAVPQSIITEVLSNLRTT